MTDVRIVVDAAGGDNGGAGRLKYELDAFLADRVFPVRLIGRDRSLTPSWLVLREIQAGRASVAVALNNVSLALRGAERRVLVHNALHFLTDAERPVLDLLPW